MYDWAAERISRQNLAAWLENWHRNFGALSHQALAEFISLANNSPCILCPQCMLPLEVVVVAGDTVMGVNENGCFVLTGKCNRCGKPVEIGGKIDTADFPLPF